MIVKELADCGVLVVGGSSGIGLESARQLARSGVPRIALMGRDAGRLERAGHAVTDVADVGVCLIQADAADVASATRGAGQARDYLGSVDVLINSAAGGYAPELLHETAVEDIEPALRGQLLAPLLMTRLVLPWMYAQEGGSVISIASDAAKVATPGETVLGAAMAGIVTFTRAAALEAKRHGVRVNALTPSLVEGTRTTELITGGGFSARLFAAAARQAHLGVVQPADVAELVVFLAGPGSQRVTGQAISINGGISAA